MKQYALYKGDKYIYGGTIYQLAQYLNVTISTIRYYLTPVYQKERMKENSYYVIEVEEDGKEEV